MKVILLGLPCAGKETQGRRLSLVFGIPQVSTGRKAREEVHARTALGLRIQADRDRQGYLTDAMSEELAGIALAGLDSWIIDGFPRNADQAQRLHGIDLVLYLELPEEISTRRMMARQRADDLRETPQVRVAKTMERLPGLVAYCRQTWPFVTINALPPEDVVWHEILAKTAHLFTK